MKHFIVSFLLSGIALTSITTETAAQDELQLETLASSVTASYTSPEYSLLYINDGKQLNTSPYWTNYRDAEHLGTEDYVEYQWALTCDISRIRVVWKTEGENIQLPTEAYFMAWDGTNWKRVAELGEIVGRGVSTNTESITTDRLRLYMRSETAVGIIEFFVYGKPVQEPFDPTKGYQWPGYMPTLDYDFRNEYPSLPAPTKGRLPENVNVAKQVDGEWWSVAVGPNANPLITEESMRLLAKKMDEDFAYFRDEMGWPPDKRARNGYYSQVYGYGSGLSFDANTPNDATGGWQSATWWNGSSWPMVFLSYYPIYSFDPKCTYGDRIAQQNACVHEGIHATFADLEGCRNSAWFHEGGNTWLQGEAEVRKSGKEPESMGFLSAGNMIAPFMPIECYSGWLQDDSFGGPSAEGVNMYEGSQQICTWRNLLGGVQYGELFPHFLSEILGKGSIPWIWRYCKNRVLQGMAEGITEDGKKIPGLGDAQMRRLILEYRSRQAMLDVGLWTKACEALLDNNWRVAIKAEWKPSWKEPQTWYATPYAKMTAITDPDSTGWYKPEWRTTPGWSGANQIVIHINRKVGETVTVGFRPFGKNMVCQLCYKTKRGTIWYGEPLYGEGEASILLNELPANSVIFAIVCNTDYVYTGEAQRKSHYYYHLRMGRNAYQPASPNYKWYKHRQNINDTTFDGIKDFTESEADAASFAVRPARTKVRAGEQLPLTFSGVQSWQIPVQLYNAAGGLIYQHSFLRDGTLPLPSDLTPGLYILRATDHNQQATVKIIVER